MKPVRSIVIVGGGTAGWLVAARMAAHHHAYKENSISVTLIESPNIPTIGVGEGTWPTMRETLRKIGLSESEFLRRCDGAFKQGGKFAKWTTGAEDDFYYHPFGAPIGYQKLTLAPYWSARPDRKFADAVDIQHQICEAGLAPKNMTTAEYGYIANYAYHLDAGKFAALLKEHAVGKLGVKHILDDVTTVAQGEDGHITSLSRANGDDLEADLYVDCTGFRSLLLGDHLGVGFKSQDHVLFANHALAMQVPYENEDDPIACHTIATGQEAGWTWDIGLPSRRGVGYVYSSNHTSHERAEELLRAHIGPQAEKLDARRIPIRSGHREKFWEKNVVAVGLSAGFLEPLEASALLLVELAADMITEQLPATMEIMPAIARKYNELFLYRWDRIIDFLKLHYMLTKRDDTDFWIDNRNPNSIPDALKERLDVWRHLPPSDYDFTGNNEVFSWASYHYVLYGMYFETDYSPIQSSLHDESLAQRLFAANARAIQSAMAKLPAHRDLLNQLKHHSFQAI